MTYFEEKTPIFCKKKPFLFAKKIRNLYGGCEREEMSCVIASCNKSAHFISAKYFLQGSPGI
jgi:hypothetical protein